MHKAENTSVLDAKFCHDCLLEYCRCTKKMRECEYAKPNNERFIADKIVASIRQSIIYERAPLWEVCEHNMALENDSARLDIYYICFINDCLRAIREKEIVYVFRIRHLRDILRFQPDIRVGYRDGIYYVSLPLAPKNKRRRRSLK